MTTPLQNIQESEAKRFDELLLGIFDNGIQVPRTHDEWLNFFASSQQTVWDLAQKTLLERLMNEMANRVKHRFNSYGGAMCFTKREALDFFLQIIKDIQNE